MHSPDPVVVCLAITILIFNIQTLNSFELSMNSGCREPENFPPLGSDLGNDTVHIIPGYVLDTDDGDLGTVPQQYVNIERVPVEVNTTRGQLVRSHYSVRSTCPWSFIKNIDQNRNPEEIFEAKCVSQCCNGQSECFNEASHCREIVHYMTVMRRVSCTNGVFQYSQISEPVAVGCTCITRNPAQSGVRRMGV